MYFSYKPRQPKDESFSQSFIRKFTFLVEGLRPIIRTKYGSLFLHTNQSPI
jgi:hypothetical protein